MQEDKYQLLQLILNGKIEGKRWIRRKKMAWLRNLRQWKALSAAELIHAAYDRNIYHQIVNARASNGGEWSMSLIEEANMILYDEKTNIYVEQKGGRFSAGNDDLIKKVCENQEFLFYKRFSPKMWITRKCYTV